MGLAGVVLRFPDGRGNFWGCSDNRVIVGVDRFSSRWPSDAVLIADSVGRPGLFAVVFDRHFDAVHAYLARRVGADGADDLASATFTTAFARRGSFRAMGDSARPWLLGIATNLLRNQWRADQRAGEAVARAAADAAVVAGDVDRGSPARRVVEAEAVAGLLAALDGDQRDVLLLFVWEGLSYEEIAMALEVPVGTVRSRLARARARLRSVLESERDEATGAVREELG